MPSHLFRNANVLADGEARLLPARDVLVTGNRIVRVTPTGEAARNPTANKAAVMQAPVAKILFVMDGMGAP